MKTIKNNKLIFGLIVANIALAIVALMPPRKAQAGTPAFTASAGSIGTVTDMFDSGFAGFPDKASYRAFKFTGTSSAGGALTVGITNLYGLLVDVKTNPAAAGDAPTDDWDMTLLDEFGLDAFATLGTNRDTADSEHFAPFLGDGTNFIPMPLSGTYTHTCTNMGAANLVEFIFVIKQ